MIEERYSASKADVASAFPKYRASSHGLRNYWYPVELSQRVKKRPIAVKVCGEDIVLVREGSVIYALGDRCPHRGVPLSLGRKEFPETITCAYHGWTYELSSGELCAVLTDSPDSPICGKANVRVRTYPVTVVAGIVWVFVGDIDPPPPPSEDIPKELLAEGATVIRAFRKVQPWNWRLGAESGIDSGHAQYLHRRSLWYTFAKVPAWREFSLSVNHEGWLERTVEKTHWVDEYPKVGSWPRKFGFWKRDSGFGPRLSIGLPGIVRVKWPSWTNLQIWVPVDADHVLQQIFLVFHDRSRIKAFAFRLKYWIYVKWVYVNWFQNQDIRMLKRMQVPPEQLYGPDKSITMWRRLVESEPRNTSDARE